MSSESLNLSLRCYYFSCLAMFVFYENLNVFKLKLNLLLLHKSIWLCCNHQFLMIKCLRITLSSISKVKSTHFSLFLMLSPLPFVFNFPSMCYRDSKRGKTPLVNKSSFPLPSSIHIHVCLSTLSEFHVTFLWQYFIISFSNSSPFNYSYINV